MNPMEGLGFRVDNIFGSAATFSVIIVNKLSVTQQA